MRGRRRGVEEASFGICQEGLFRNRSSNKGSGLKLFPSTSRRRKPLIFPGSMAKEEMKVMPFMEASNLEAGIAEGRWRKLRDHIILVTAAAILLLLAILCIPECPPP